MTDDPNAADSAIAHTRDVVEGRAPMDPKLRAELEGMLAQHVKRVWNTCFRITRDPELANDLTQDALETAFRSLPGFEGRSSLSTWVCGIARNLALNRVRKKGELLTEDGVVEPMDPGAGVLRALSRAEREHVVQAASATVLDAQEQEVVHLRYAENLPYEVIASVLGLDGGANTVRVILQRCSRRLKPELTRRLEELGHGLSFVRTSELTGSG